MDQNISQPLRLRSFLFESALTVILLGSISHGYAQSQPQPQVCYTYSSSIGYCTINAITSSTPCLLEQGEMTVDKCEADAISYATQIGAASPTTPCPEWVQDMTSSMSYCPNPAS